jgi:hypothetical protein
MRGVIGSTPEYRALGFDENVLKEMERFDLHQLPEEVLRRSYFV